MSQIVSANVSVSSLKLDQLLSAKEGYGLESGQEVKTFEAVIAALRLQDNPQTQNLGWETSSLEKEASVISTQDNQACKPLAETGTPTYQSIGQPWFA